MRKQINQIGMGRHGQGERKSLRAAWRLSQAIGGQRRQVAAAKTFLVRRSCFTSMSRSFSGFIRHLFISLMLLIFARHSAGQRSRRQIWKITMIRTGANCSLATAANEREGFSLVSHGLSTRTSPRPGSEGAPADRSLCCIALRPPSERRNPAPRSC